MMGHGQSLPGPHGSDQGAGATERPRQHHVKLCGVWFLTYNVRTLHQYGKMDQLVKELDKQPSVEKVGIQEYRGITTDTIAHHWTENRDYLFVYDSADKNCVGGVGLMVSAERAKSFRTAERISDLILVVCLQGPPMAAIVVVTL